MVRGGPLMIWGGLGQKRGKKNSTATRSGKKKFKKKFWSPLFEPPKILVPPLGPMKKMVPPFDHPKKFWSPPQTDGPPSRLKMIAP